MNIRIPQKYLHQRDETTHSDLGQWGQSLEDSCFENGVNRVRNGLKTGHYSAAAELSQLSGVNLLSQLTEVAHLVGPSQVRFEWSGSGHSNRVRLVRSELT